MEESKKETIIDTAGKAIPDVFKNIADSLESGKSVKVDFSKEDTEKKILEENKTKQKQPFILRLWQFIFALYCIVLICASIGIFINSGISTFQDEKQASIDLTTQFSLGIFNFAIYNVQLGVFSFVHILVIITLLFLIIAIITIIIFALVNLFNNLIIKKIFKKKENKIYTKE
jgi:hypothetical protein